MNKRSFAVVAVIALVLLIDQALKIYIKLNFEYNEAVPMLGQQWAQLRFVENEGMAFGITFDWEYGKLALSMFRILMVCGLIWYIRTLIQMAAPVGLLVSVGLITAGALGNIIDSAFYGLWFTESPYHGSVAQWASAEFPGYGSFLHGKVVDMLFFPIVDIPIPEWIPKIGGETWQFFSPIFNIADAAITCGVISIFLFQRSFFKEPNPAPALVSELADDTSSDLSADEATTETVAVAEAETETEAINTMATDETTAENPVSPPSPHPVNNGTSAT
jgi:signal peptidase II